MNAQTALIEKEGKRLVSYVVRRSQTNLSIDIVRSVNAFHQMMNATKDGDFSIVETGEKHFIVLDDSGKGYSLTFKKNRLVFESVSV